MKKIFDEATVMDEFKLSSDEESDDEILKANQGKDQMRDVIEEEFDADVDGEHTTKLRNKIIKKRNNANRQHSRKLLHAEDIKQKTLDVGR